MVEASDNFSGRVNSQFADDIDLIVGSKEELEDLTTRLDTVSRKHGMEISAERMKSLVPSRTNVKDSSDVQINVSDKELEAGSANFQVRWLDTECGCHVGTRSQEETGNCYKPTRETEQNLDIEWKIHRSQDQTNEISGNIDSSVWM